MPRWTEADRTPLASLRANAYLSRNEAAVRLHVGVTTLARYENEASFGSVSIRMIAAAGTARIYVCPPASVVSRKNRFPLRASSSDQSTTRRSN